MICLKLNCFFYGLSRMLQLSQYVWAGAKLFGMRRLLQVSPYRRNLSLKHLSCRTSLKIPLYNKFLPPPLKKKLLCLLFLVCVNPHCGSPPF